VEAGATILDYWVRCPANWSKYYVLWLKIAITPIIKCYN